MAARSVAVVGAGVAGLRACEGLRERGFAGGITLIGSESHLPYDRPPLSKQFLAGEWGRDRVFLRTPEKMGELDLELRLGPSHRAVGLDLAGKVVRLASGETVGFDGVVLATGSTARQLPGISDLPGAHVLRTLDDAETLRGVITKPGARLGLVGAGFIGLEVAATARRLGAEVTVVESLAVPLGKVLGAVCGGACEHMHREEGVRFHLGAGIESAEVGEAGVPGKAGDAATGPIRCMLSDGTTIEVDALLVGVGASPSLSWLDGSGLDCGPDGVVCDASLMAAPGVAVAGDIARWPLPVAGKPLAEAEPVRVEHRTNAAEQGDWAAAALLADLGLPAPFTEDPPPYVVPYVWSDQYGVKIQVIGLPGPDDEVVVVEGDPADRRFVALHAREGRLQAVVGFARPRHVMSLRPFVARRAPLEEARAFCD